MNVVRTVKRSNMRTPKNKVEPSATATAPAVGHMLQTLRLSRSLTLDHLARISGVSKSVLSQIERDRTNPTLGTLWRLAEALGVEIEDLLRRRKTSAGINILDEHNTPILLSSDRRCTIRILGPLELAGRVEWYEMRFETGGALVSEPHEPGTIEHLTVLEGQLEVESGRQRERALLGLGQTARYRADQSHAIRNLFGPRALAIVIVTSGMLAPDTTRTAKASPAARFERCKR